MEKNKCFKYIWILLIILATYLITVTSENQFWSNITSPIAAFSAAYVIWRTGKQREHHKIIWLHLALMAFSWGFADSLWMVSYNIMGLDPEEMAIFNYLYLVPNIILASMTVVYFFRNIKKWHKVQLLLDVMITWAIALTFLWHIILKKYELSYIGFDEMMSSFLYVFTDFLAASIVFVVYLSAKVHKLSGTMKCIIYGISLYTLCDLYYIFLVFENAYIPNSLIDFGFMSAIILFAVASVLEAYKPTLKIEPVHFEIPENMGKSGKYFLLLLLPTISFLTGNFPGSVLRSLVVIAIVHQVISVYVQVAIRSEYLLKKEKLMNEKLEDMISERTRDLIMANKTLDELLKVDTLTDLYNRRYFLEELDNMISTPGSEFSILYMDLDRFKIINDTHGHDIGDKILKEIADRLSAWRHGEVLIARLGGDEFAAIIKNQTGDDALRSYCKEIADQLGKPIIIGSYIFNIGASIGISRYPIDAEDRDQLTKYADIAMYNAKKKYGGKRWTLYNPVQSNEIQRRHEIEILLRNADFDKEFELFFQPQFKAKTNELIGAEALLRWKSPAKGSISPSEFIPIAEETGAILSIGNWVMNRAAAQICEWNNKYSLNLVMGINISPKQIDSIDFISDIQEILRGTEVKPEWVDFEITESSAMNTNIIMEDILTQLTVMGIRLSIDDFGTGYSSLSYIKRFNIDRLKIAKELIDNISTDSNALLIVKAIILMSKGMGTVTLAEGVEKEEQLNILRMLGCDAIQGFYMGRPVPADVFEARLLYPVLNKAQNE